MTGDAATSPPAERYSDIVQRLAGAQKKRARGAPAYSVYVNRPAGRRLAAIAYLAGLTPNVVSIISAGFTFGAIAVIAAAPALPWVGVLVAALLLIGYALDSSDGQLARLRGGGTPAGEWLDHVLDAAKTSALHLAVLITFYLHFPITDAAWLLVPIGFTVVATVSFFAMILNDQLKGQHATAAEAPPRASSPLRSLLGIPTDYGVLCLSFLTLGFPLVFLGVYTILFVANAAYLLLALVKWFRDMGALVPGGKS
ncbi:CDP-alcohol phosphatidyltransferase [Leifsonia sp. Leaf325]|nr:CDP-alcohol phosphatidyltransferase family protein [Leifsonia sp. Leaf325]KQQ93921.1 CDP-alcohol phosphatidyltransferase [Leifsonia sp. Leaf325]